MKETPILMCGEMVRASLRAVDPKTQTRRIVKPQPGIVHVEHVGAPPDVKTLFATWSKVGSQKQYIACPYGAVGDRLWVRENFSIRGICHAIKPSKAAKYASKSAWIYAADGATGWKWKPSIFMPRKASRITLEIVAVRVERLQDISEADAVAEGVQSWVESGGKVWTAHESLNITTPARLAYRSLWESINGKGSWVLNPYVWVIEFKRV